MDDSLRNRLDAALALLVVAFQINTAGAIGVLVLSALIAIGLLQSG